MLKNKKWKNVTVSLIMILVMLVMMSYVSYSWIKREWAPSIKQDGITITTNGSLVLNLGSGEGYEEEQTINEILGVDSFILQPVSNSSGESDDFFTLDFGGGPGNEMYVWLNRNDYGSYSNMGAENGYIEFQFTLCAPSASEVKTYRYVYIDCDDDSENPESYITSTGAASKALRMSISFSEGATKVFGTYTKEELEEMKRENKPLQAITNDTNDNGLHIADKALYYAQYSETNEEDCIVAETIRKNSGDTGKALHEEVNLLTFSDCNGKDENGNWNPNNALVVIEEGKNAKATTVTVRIWVEGADPNCIGEISGQQINLKLKFGSFALSDASSETS
ncbi:MAG: hypothetical protein E7674_05445 [Ruminococcaceae bacterium]|nr:hypothetical protein [Oscillospiraceae bacterium]